MCVFTYHVVSKEMVGQTLEFGIQLALTEYRVLSSYGQRCSLIEISTFTGFKHQVMVFGSVTEEGPRTETYFCILLKFYAIVKLIDVYLSANS